MSTLNPVFVIPTYRLRDRKLESLIRNLFRPSYGGNRNYTMYTLGDFMVSADDEMRPTALMEESPWTLGDNGVCRANYSAVPTS